MKFLFEHMNFELPDLELVRRAVNAQNWSEAAMAYLEYSRNRTPPASWWIPLYGHESFEQRSSWFDFFIEQPESISWRDRERLRGQISTHHGYTSRDEPLSYTVVDLADMILEHKMFHPWWPDIPPEDVGAEWNWDHIPPDGDQSWTIHMQRLEHLGALAQAYWLTDEEKYIRKMVALATDFITSKPDLLLEALNDITHPILFQSILPFALSWDGLAAMDLCTIQSWLLKQAVGMMGYRRRGNQLVATGKTLVALGLRSPEFRDANAWFEEGFSRIRDYLTDASTYPDGSHKEPCFSYNNGSLKNPLYAMELTDQAGWNCPEDIKTLVQRAARFLAFTVRPDGLHPWMGNGRRGSAIPSVNAALDRIPDDTLEYIASSGRKGVKPSSSSEWFPHAGYGVMRSNWDPDAHYCLFDVGPLGIQHAHEDKLSVEIGVYGRSLIEDLGIHTYSTAGHTMPLRNYFCNTHGHNTVIVDGKSQIRQIQKEDIETDATLGNVWVSTDVCDFLEGTYGSGWGENVWNPGVESLYPVLNLEGTPDTSIVQKRSVIFMKAAITNAHGYWIITDRLLGSGSHTFEQLFHFIPVDLDIDENAKTVRTITPGMPNLALIPANPEGLELRVYRGEESPRPRGWYVEKQPAVVVPAPEVVFERTGRAPAAFQTVVYPLKTGETQTPNIISFADGHGLAITFPDGRKDLYVNFDEAGSHTAGDIVFEGLAALVRLSATDTTEAHQVIGGNALRFRDRELAEES